ncbi:MAG TPA: glycosyltransferase family A protein [Pyrinomonadaceae bacterium]|nr:glycosyltransferase family A protein [Pyrinomonadaceae bacterium]
MNPPLVTVVIPSYNYGHLIDQTLESVLAQTYVHWECFVVDDGSTDNTKEVVKRFVDQDSRIRYIFQQNLRAGAARNHGMRKGSGKYLQFLDADDLIEKTKLENQVAYLEQHPEIDIVYGGIRYFRTEERLADLSRAVGEEVTWMPRISGSGRDAVLALIRLPIVIHSPLVRKGAGDSLVYFEEDLNACEDWLYWVTSALKGKRFHYEEIEGTLGFYRAHLNSACANQPFVDVETRRLRRILKTIISDREGAELNRRLGAEYEGNIGINEVLSGSVRRAVWQFLKAAAKSPRMREKVKWLFCAGAAPFAPKQRFEKLVVTPLGKSIAGMLRFRSPRNSY